MALRLKDSLGAQERVLVAGAQSDLTPAVLAVPAEVVYTTSAKKPRGDKFCAEMERISVIRIPFRCPGTALGCDNETFAKNIATYGDLNTFGSSQILRARLRGALSALAMIRPPKKTNIPAVIFGFAVLATIGTASHAVMSRSIDKVP